MLLFVGSMSSVILGPAQAISLREGLPPQPRPPPGARCPFLGRLVFAGLCAGTAPFSTWHPKRAARRVHRSAGGNTGNAVSSRRARKVVPPELMEPKALECVLS